MDKLMVTRADGNRYLCPDGQWLLDFSSGGFGNGNPALRECVAGQAARLSLSSRNFFNENLALFCAAIADRLPDHQSVFPCNSFDEALDGALKLAKGARSGRSGVLVIGPAPRSRTFYGSRLDATRADQTWNSAGFVVDHLDWTDLGALRQSLRPSIYAVVVSKAVGLQPDRADCDALRAACDATDAVMIANEEETGLGAQGALTSLGAVNPDIYVFGSALGGIMPFAAYAARKSLNDRVYKHRDPVLHATTTGGNPLGCAAARAVLEQIDALGLYANAQSVGQRVARLLSDCIGIGNGCGFINAYGSHLLWALVFESDNAAVAFIASARKSGLLLTNQIDGKAGHVGVRIPLTVSESEIVMGLDVLAGLLASSTSRMPVDA